jgi:hypothetical protein
MMMLSINEASLAQRRGKSAALLSPCHNQNSPQFCGFLRQCPVTQAWHAVLKLPAGGASSPFRFVFLVLAAAVLAGPPLAIDACEWSASLVTAAPHPFRKLY